MQEILNVVDKVNGTPAILPKRDVSGFYRRKAIRQHRITNPIAPNQADIVNWILYDRVVTAAAANTAVQYTFFQQPIGTAGKLKEDTNLEQVQRLPDPQWFNTYTLGFYFDSEMVKVDIDSFLKDYYFEFWVGQKIYLEGPLQAAPSGYGLYGASTKNNEGAWANGYPAQANVFDFRVPPPMGDGVTGVTILQGQQFQVRVIGTAFALGAAAAPLNGIGLDLMCILTGVLSRGVQ